MTNANESQYDNDHLPPVDDDYFDETWRPEDEYTEYDTEFDYDDDDYDDDEIVIEEEEYED